MHGQTKSNKNNELVLCGGTIYHLTSNDIAGLLCAVSALWPDSSSALRGLLWLYLARLPWRKSHLRDALLFP